MADITPNIVVSQPSQLFTLARSFKANANGKIYIGQIDTDPTIPSNQIQVYLENEDGSHVPVAQPIVISAGGFPVYNGQIAKFVTVHGHSMAIYDTYNVQQFYFPNVLKYDPDQFRTELSLPSGAGEIGTESGITVQDKLNVLQDNIYKINNEIKSTYKTAIEIGSAIQQGSDVVIAFCGDSTMFGATSMNTSLQSEQNPPSMFSQACRFIFGRSPEVRNYAVSGTTLHGFVSGEESYKKWEEFSIELYNSGVRCVFINFGINDSKKGYSLKTYRDELAEFVIIARNNELVPVFCTPNPNAPYDLISEAEGKQLANYIDVMHSVAKQFVVSVVDQHRLIMDSINDYSISEMIPDGAHPANFVYRQMGYNMLIPFIAANDVTSYGDVSTMAMSQFRVNGNGNQIIQKTSGMGGVSVSISYDGVGGISYPVILNKSISKNELVVLGLRWTSGGNSMLSVNGGNEGFPNVVNENTGGYEEFYSAGNEYGNSVTLKFDSEYPISCKMMAGLNIISMLLTEENNNSKGVAMNGILLKDPNFISVNMKSKYITPKSSVFMRVTFSDLDETPIFFADHSNALAFRLRRNQASELSFETIKGSVSIGILVAGTYDVNIIFFVSSGVYKVRILIGNIDKTVDLETPMPDMIIASPSLAYITS